MVDVKKIVAAILLFSLLSPVLMPLAALASGRGGPMSGGECATGKGRDCMEGDRCTMNHRECRMHAAKKDTGREMRGGDIHHHGEPTPGPPHCDAFYRCGADDGQEAFSLNALETPFLLSTNRSGAAPPLASLFSAAMTAYSGPSLPQPERPPSISPLIHG